MTHYTLLNHVHQRRMLDAAPVPIPFNDRLPRRKESPILLNAALPFAVLNPKALALPMAATLSTNCHQLIVNFYQVQPKCHPFLLISTSLVAFMGAQQWFTLMCSARSFVLSPFCWCRNERPNKQR